MGNVMLTIIGDDEEWNEKLEEARKGQDKKLGIARERFRLANEAIRTEFQASVEQIQEEFRVFYGAIDNNSKSFE